MKFGVVVQVVGVVLCLAAALICYNMVLKHVTGTSGAAWFEAGCSDNPAAGGANCAAVLASPYSYFPPKKTKEADGRGRLPVAFLGLVYYSTLMTWLIGIGRPSPRRRWLHVIPLLLVGMGLAGSAYYMTIMFRVLDQWCPWCVVTHVLNLLIAVCLVLLWPRKLKLAAASADQNSASFGGRAVTLATPFPSARAVMITILAIAAVAYGELNMLGLKTWRRQATSATENYNTCLAAVNRIKGDSDTLWRNWVNVTKRDIVIRPDDPARTGGGFDPQRPTLDVVVFSDFECPSCERFATFIDESAQRLFEGGLKVVFKHYPLDRSCNARVGNTVHPHACAAASMAEGARLLGGNAAFWKAHDYLFKQRDLLVQGKLTPEALSAELNLTVGALREAQASQAVASRLNEDIDQAKQSEIKGTPAVFVEGKLVDTLAATELGFWDKLADGYWQKIQTPRPEATKLRPSSATPGTPGRKDGP